MEARNEQMMEYKEHEKEKGCQKSHKRPKEGKNEKTYFKEKRKEYKKFCEERKKEFQKEQEEKLYR